MEKVYIIIGIVFIIVMIIDCLVRKKSINKDNSYEEKDEKEEVYTNKNECPYCRTDLLTKSEWAFYKYKLKPIADKYNLHILSKVRMEDIIAVKKGLDNKIRQSARNKIKCRHIDFVITNPENLRILLAIELDGKSHEKIDQQQADYFKNTIFEDVGLPLIRTNGQEDIETLICEKLKITKR